MPASIRTSRARARSSDSSSPASCSARHERADFAARTRFGRLVAQGGIASGMLNALVAMDLPGAGTVFMSQSLSYKAPTYLGDRLTAEVEVVSLKPDKPVCQLRATITNQDGTVILEGECR